MFDQWWHRLSRYDGRLGRLQYLGYHAMLYVSLLLGCLIGMVAFWLLDAIDASVRGAAMLGTAIMIIMLIGSFAAYLWCTVCVTIRRLHDMDLSGWWYAALFIIATAGAASAETNPGLSVLFTISSLVGSIALLFVPGTKGPNRFDPKDNI